ncbi:hypothetical protein WN943_010461 [Citrus x changshan-huyou]
MQSIQQANLDVQYLESATVDPQRAHNLVKGVAKTPRLILSASVVLAVEWACASHSLVLFDNLTFFDVAIKEIGSSSTIMNLAG